MTDNRSSKSKFARAFAKEVAKASGLEALLSHYKVFCESSRREKSAGSGLARAGTRHHVCSYSLEPVLTSAFACTFQSRSAESQLSAPEPDKSARNPFVQEVP
jgi:hypothetical protein